MAFYPFDTSTPHVVYACFGGFVVLFGMFSLFLRERLYIGEACWAFAFGIAIGPYGANIFNPGSWSNDPYTNETITLEFTRVVLAIGVFAAGVELPKAYWSRHWKSLLFLLGPVMTWGWFISALFIYGLIPNLNFLSSLAVAACFTPTDPILAQAVIGGKYADKHVPAHIRHLLSAEAGSNDGAAFPFLYIALYLVLDSTKGNAIRDWFLLLWLYQILLGIFCGALIGTTFRQLFKYCEKHDLIDRHSSVAQYLTLALFTIGVTTLLGTDDLLAAFSCGTAFAWDGFFNKQTEESVFSSVIDLLFNITAFIYVGAWMPFAAFQNPELSLSIWRLIVLAILVLLFKRLPVMLLLYKWIPDVKTFREALFTGHFGPMGIGAIFISTLAARILDHESQSGDGPKQVQIQAIQRSIQPITAFMVLCSILIHGLSIPSFSLGRRIHTLSSRTWSRRSSIAGPLLPDWTNQTTMVTRPEQVVINRDKGGQQPPVPYANNVNSGSAKWTAIERTNSTSGRETILSGSISIEHDVGPAQVSQEEVTVTEWLEGPHKVIERRKGPGEEIEVEVIQNYESPHANSSVFLWPHGSVREHLHAMLSKLRQHNGTEQEPRTEDRHPESYQQEDSSQLAAGGSSHSLPLRHALYRNTSELSFPDKEGTSGSVIQQPYPQRYNSYDDLREGSRRTHSQRALHTQNHRHGHHRELSPSRSVRFRETTLPERSSGTSTPKLSSVFRYGSPNSTFGEQNEGEKL